MREGEKEIDREGWCVSEADCVCACVCVRAFVLVLVCVCERVCV